MSFLDFKRKNYDFFEYMTSWLKLFEFKKRYQDFIVEEKINIPVDNSGHVFFVFFEKKWLNTMDIIDHLSKWLNLQRKHFWIWWLKDKVWITRQWISIYKRTLNSRWGKTKFLKLLSSKSKILKYWWWDRLLKVGDNVWNLFFIRLRGKRKFNQEEKKKILDLLKKEEIKLFPNFFWLQRFWQWFQNVKLADKFLSGQVRIKKEFERQFKLQAFSSFLFNFYLYQRIKKWFLFKTMEGDIKLNENWEIKKWKQSLSVVKGDELSYTWPVYGADLLLPPENTQSYIFEKWVINKFFNDFKLKEKEVLKIYEKNQVFWIRRNGLCKVNDLRAKWQWNDLLLMFELPSWSYASVFVWWVEKKIRQEIG